MSNRGIARLTKGWGAMDWFVYYLRMVRYTVWW